MYRRRSASPCSAGELPARPSGGTSPRCGPDPPGVSRLSRSSRRPRAAQYTSSTSGFTASGSTPARSGGRQRRHGTRPAAPRREARPAPVSELEQALNASLDAPPGPADFAALRLPQPLLTGLQRRGISTPFPIQARTLPDALAGRDLLGRAETGSGKTLAFGLPMLARLMGGTRPPGRRTRRPGPGPDPRAGPAGAGRAGPAGPAARRAGARGLRRRLDGPADLGPAPRGRPARRHPRPAARPDPAGRVLARPRSRSPRSTRPTTWPTSASCPTSPRSST